MDELTNCINKTNELIYILHTLELENTIRKRFIVFDRELSVMQIDILEANLYRLTHINKILIRGDANAILRDIQSLVNLDNVESIDIEFPHDILKNKYTDYPLDLSLIKPNIKELVIGGLDGLHCEFNNIDQFTDIKRLSLYCCRLGIIPKNVYKMNSLVDASFMLCQIIHASRDDIQSMTNLKNINLMYNPLNFDHKAI